MVPDARENPRHHKGMWGRATRTTRKLRNLHTRVDGSSRLMGCTHEATFSVSGAHMLREERTYARGRLATESLIVERLCGLP